jgi:hypothetical protein
VQTKESEALGIWGSIIEVLPPFQMQWLMRACEMSSALTGSSEEIAILRFLASKALRAKCTVEDVLAEIARTHSAKCILF